MGVATPAGKTPPAGTHTPRSFQDNPSRTEAEAAPPPSPALPPSRGKGDGRRSAKRTITLSQRLWAKAGTQIPERQVGFTWAPAFSA